jgi:LAO/AO transport system kinase
LASDLNAGDFRALARAITIVENNLQGASDLLRNLKHSTEHRVVGITGPPGAGKSTLVNALLHEWVSQGLRIAVLAIDPTSPFNYGALLGDRIRMTDFYGNPQVFIRSLASRGSLGGLHPKIIEVCDIVKQGRFDIILVETVGVGQSEVEIAGLSDCTVVVLVPEAGDEIQTMKSGVLEIADVFVVNKGDRPDSDAMVRRLRALAHERHSDEGETPVLKTVASCQDGIVDLAKTIRLTLASLKAHPERHLHLLTEKALQLILGHRAKGLSKVEIRQKLKNALLDPEFNLYSFAEAEAHPISL